MKKGNIWYVLFCCFVVICISALLIFRDYFYEINDDENNEDLEISIIENADNRTVDNDLPEEENQNEEQGNSTVIEFATELTISKLELTIAVGDEITLIDFIKVLPESKQDEVVATLRVTDCLSFNAFKISANAVGVGYIDFSVKNSATTSLVKTLTINVVTKNDFTLIQQLKSEIYLNDEYVFNDLFGCNSDYHVLIGNIGLVYVNNIIKGTTAGKHLVSISVQFEDYIYLYNSFVEVVEKQDTYSIVFGQEFGEDINLHSMLLLNYEIYCNGIFATNQYIEVECSQSGMIDVLIQPPMITLIKKNDGVCKLTFKIYGTEIIIKELNFICN